MSGTRAAVMAGKGQRTTERWLAAADRIPGGVVKAEVTAIIEPAPEGGFWAICQEVPGANGQGETIEETKKSLKAAIEFLLEDRRTDVLRGLPADAIQDKVVVG